MIRRKRPLSETSSRGFSFDLVARRKDKKSDDEPAKVRSPLELLTDAAPQAPTEPVAPVSAAQPAPQPVAEPAAPTEAKPLFLSEPMHKAAMTPAEPAPVAAQPTPAEPVAETPVQAEPASDEASPRRKARVKTTFLGFERSDGRIEDILAAGQSSPEAKAVGEMKFPVGWLVIAKGPGRGNSISLQSGVSQIGRGDDQAVQLDFGDNGVSRSNHAAIAFDDEEGKFFLGHGGKANLVRLNGKPVLSTEELSSGDEVRISETTLRFIALCGDDFTWAENE